MQQMTLATLAQQNLKMPEGDFYKFTNLPSFLKSFSEKSGETKNLAPKCDFPTLILENGKLTNPEFKLDGVTITLHTKKSVSGRSYPLSQIQEGLSQSFEILIGKNAQVERPLRILHVHTDNKIAAPTIIIRAQENSQVTILEEIFGTHVAALSEAQVMVATGAKVEHIQLNDLDEGSFFHGATVSDVARDATYRNFILNLGGKLNRRNLDLKLNSPGAHGESYNLFLTNDHEHSDINTVIEHISADSTSEQLAKGILDNESKGIFTGKIHIHPKAQRVASGQLNKNLLLSKKAQAHSQPQLEIFADDVKCSHGSTTGQLSPDELFYFEARGIPNEKARTLLAHGFGLEVVLKIQNKEARERISGIILERLKTKFHIGEKQ